MLGTDSSRPFFNLVSIEREKIKREKNLRCVCCCSVCVGGEGGGRGYK